MNNGLIVLLGFMAAHWVLIFYLMRLAELEIWDDRRRRYTLVPAVGVLTMFVTATIFEQSGCLR